MLLEKAMGFSISEICGGIYIPSEDFETMSMI